MSRTIEFHVDPTDLQNTEAELYRLYGADGILKMQQAIGRLATFCPDTYDRVSIYFNKRQMEFVAGYTSTQSVHRFTLGAVYRGSLPGENELKPCEWSFHS